MQCFHASPVVMYTCTVLCSPRTKVRASLEAEGDDALSTDIHFIAESECICTL